MIDLQLVKMDSAHRLSQPSHINMILRNDVDIAFLDRIKAVPGVDRVDTMTQLTVGIKLPGTTSPKMSTLIIRPEFSQQRFDITTLQSGNWPSANQIAIEYLSAQFTGLKIGDRIEFETVSGHQLLPISGIVRHPFIKPPGFGGQLHFFAGPTTASLFAIPPHTFRQLLVQITPPYSAEKVRAIASEIRTLLNSNNFNVNVTLLQDPEKHWGRPFFSGVNLVLQILALTSLALASALILNTVSAHITQQTDQIGVMKSLGARTITITKHYLSETLIITFAALLLAVPVSLTAAYLSSCKLLDLFNIDCGHFDYSTRAVSFMLLGGLLAPLLAALGPIIRGASMPVRESIASYGLGGSFGVNRFDLWVERIGMQFLPTLYAAALGNLFRRKDRLMLTQIVLIIAGILFLVLMSLITSVNLTLDNEMARSHYTLRLGFAIDQPEQKVMDLAKSVTKTQKVEVWQRLPMEISINGITLSQKGSLGAQLLSVPSGTEMYKPLIEKGRWLQAADAGHRVLVLSTDSANLNGIKVGDSLAIRLKNSIQNWQVIGLYRWLAGSNYTVEPIYVPLETVRNLNHSLNLASFALLDAPIDNIKDEYDFVEAIKKSFQNNGIKLDVYTTLARLEQRQFARNQFNPVIGTLLGLAVMIAVVGGIGLSGALAISVLQRTREIGVLRAIGAPSKAIFRLFLMEGFMHGIFAWTLSVPLAYFAAEPIASQLGKTMLGIQLDFRFNSSAVLFWLGIVLMLAWLASYWPARKATQLTIQNCLGH